MKHTKAIFQKQIKDTLKNKTVLIQFVMFPLMTIIMENAVRLEDMPEHFFAKLFAVMYLGMAPLTGMAAIIAEEKEKNTLRVLLLSDVKPAEYLLGIGSYIWCICMAGSAVIGVTAGWRGRELWAFLAAMALGILVSLLFGAVIGVWSGNQMAATSLTVPAMVIFSFLPMLAMFNETIAAAAKFVWSWQLYRLLQASDMRAPELEQVWVIGANFLAAVLLFAVAYRRRGLE